MSERTMTTTAANLADVIDALLRAEGELEALPSATYQPRLVDPLAARIVEGGRLWKTKARPKGIAVGDPLRCFYNALRIARERPTPYVLAIGWALMPGTASPTAHSWLVDRRDLRAVEVTWPEVGDGYYGVTYQEGGGGQ